MGNPLSRAMSENMEKNKEFMAEMQSVTLSRQLAMQNCMRERMMAAQLARGRDLFAWFSSFYAVYLVAAIAGFRQGRKALMGPVLPLTFMLGYQYDLSYGSKLNRIQKSAESILTNEFDLLAMPNGMVTLEEIDRRRAGN